MPEEKDRIKSACEIAMEKVRKLGSLSAEEQKKMKETELLATAEAYSGRCQKGMPVTQLILDLERFPSEDRTVIKKHLVRKLAATVELKDLTANQRTYELLEGLTGNRKEIDCFVEITKEYQAALARARNENLSRLSASKIRGLAMQGISGSAIEPAIENSAEWRRVQSELDREFGSRLDQAKQELYGGL
ncbi:MAG: hypothetical protein IBX68_10540 [Dehalococcoidia bacterium]|nr:hypothetical protein [Dehalococcoidia bacterium]